MIEMRRYGKETQSTVISIQIREVIRFLFVIFFILASGLVYAQPFGPPLYIANPETMECKEYFTGDIRPKNFDVDIGNVNDFKNLDQACAVFKCTFTNGTILVDEDGKILEKNLCRCPEDKRWDESKGCISGSDLVTGQAIFIPEKTELNYLVIIVTLLVIIGLIFFIKRIKR